MIEPLRQDRPMQPWLLPAVILAIGLIGAGWLLGSQIKQVKLGDHYVTVRGFAERNLKSDLAVWNIRFQSSGNVFAEVLAQSQGQQKKVIEFARQQGFPAGRIITAPPRIVDRESQEFVPQQQSKLSRYVITGTVTVTSPDVDRVAAASQKVGELLQQGVLLAASPTGDVAYKFNGLNSVKPDMITEATKNARTAAQRFANDSGSKVGSIRQATQGIFSISAADASAPTGGAEAGEEGGGYPMPGVESSVMKKVRVVTTVEYYLEN